MCIFAGGTLGNVGNEVRLFADNAVVGDTPVPGLALLSANNGSDDGTSDEVHLAAHAWGNLTLRAGSLHNQTQRKDASDVAILTS